MMKAGLDALYTRHDPAAAATLFRKVLERNPTHYGATYQLATALDRAGKPAEARPLWDKVLAMAEAVRDTETASTARARLGKVEVVSEETLMQTGLDALYTQNDPNTATTLFQKVLERNPTHYGATYQLATALDRAGKAAEARPVWEKVLQMAEGNNDTQTADTARARLAQ
jgi:cytochrome c-type biogenesis protein CcmH/NrfG